MSKKFDRIDPEGIPAHRKRRAKPVNSPRRTSSFPQGSRFLGIAAFAVKMDFPLTIQINKSQFWIRQGLSSLPKITRLS